ncbi:HD-like signal output (HDOD) protein [Massilia sp. MP_M2]|uniref:HDOD domain-containing protein n=1 Tax=Massilia sp. MP_M2 TaxID=3071713 RepID=UPI00319DF0D4
MKRWLARLFGAAPTRAADQPPSSSFVPPCEAVPMPMVNDQPALDLDLAFFHWLAAPHVTGAGGDETVVLDELTRLVRDPQAASSLVPRVPAVIPQVLRSLRSESASSADLARQVAQDTVLVAEVIREVNSPYYQPGTPVRNLEGALLLLGQNGLRMLLARVAFRRIISLQTSRLARLVAPQLWNQSEKCAQAASLLAHSHGADPFEAYLAGLMHNVGLIVALRVIDGLLPTGGLPDSDAFGLRLVHAARLISAGIAGQWELPPAIGHAIAHVGNAATLSTHLPAALGEADRLAKLHMLAGGGQPAFVSAVAALPAGLRQVYDTFNDADNAGQQDA